jgi:PadR family transcriptional regulator, regulatory protein PadR
VDEAVQELPVLDTGIEAADHCRCEGGQPKNFARPCLLLLLAESSAHGYELIERLRPFGFEMGDPASVYKSLRQMEAEGLVSSSWELSSRGPARRVYALSSDGRDLLEAWAHTLESQRAILDVFLRRYSGLDATPAPRAGVPVNMSASRANGGRA